MILDKEQDKDVLLNWAKSVLPDDSKEPRTTISKCIRLYELPPGYKDVKDSVCSIGYNPQTREIYRVTIDKVLYNV